MSDQGTNGGISRRTMLATSGAVLVASCTSPGGAASGPPEADTTSGRVRGELVSGVNRFLGIRYAQSIAGANRFLPPQPVEPWDDTYDATQYADTVPQGEEMGGTPVSAAYATPDYVKVGDDCLALNVWAPANAEGKLPVMVWMHGGGFISGSGSSAVTEGQKLAERGDVVVVTTNHRLGANGLTDLSRVIGGDYAQSSNLMVRDMIASLEWVRDNIAAFGGDPDLVTIFGESGGGWKVNTLLASPAAKGLFHRAIVESGPLTRFMTPEQADEVAAKVLTALGVTKDDPEKLASITTDQIVAAQSEAMGGSGMPRSFNAPGFPDGFWPVIDGEILTGHAFEGASAPSSVDVPTLVGQNGTEMSLFMLGDKAAYELDEAGLQQRVGGMFGPELAGEILPTYTAGFPDYDPSGLWFRIISDYMMGALSSAILDSRAQTGGAPIYAYRFEWQTPIMDGKLYSPHTIEIPFVFATATDPSGKTMTGGGEDVAKLADTISSVWVEFARTGKPAASSLPEWPVYSTETRAAMHLDTESKVAPYMPPAMVAPFHNKLWKAAGVTEG